MAFALGRTSVFLSLVSQLLSSLCCWSSQIDYYPSRNNKITVAKIRGHANSTRKVTGQRVSVMIGKENNFYQCALASVRCYAFPSSLADKAVMLLCALHASREKP